MEPAGLALGIAGLAGLFSTCVDCFHLVQRGRYLGREYHILETKYTNQRLRLVTWGRACGLGEDASDEGARWSEDVHDAVYETLQGIASLLQDHQTLSKRYGLSSAESAPGRTISATVLGLVPRFRSTALASLAAPTRPRRKPSNLPAAIRWAIDDRDKFTELVQHLKDFIDDLETLTSVYNVAERQRRYIQTEVESIFDVSELKTIEEARMGTRDAIADAASLHLCRLQEGGTQATVEAITAPDPATIQNEWLHVAEPGGPSDTTKHLHHQILHRVVCDMRQTTLFLDAPTYSTYAGSRDQWLVVGSESSQQRQTSLHLNGHRCLPNLDSYLEQNSQLAWLVIREYKCSHDTNSSRSENPFQEHIRLVSPILCAELQPRYVKFPVPNFVPGLELCPPYEWYYHNRQQLSVGLDIPGHPFSHIQDWMPWPKEAPTEAQSVALSVLQYIEDSMRESYKIVSGMQLVDKNAILWEHLTLLFTPGGLIVQCLPDGDDDYRAFEQIGYARVTTTMGDEAQEIFEITVQRDHDECFAYERRTLHISKSLFANGPVRADDLLIVPRMLQNRRNNGYLYKRGEKCSLLKHGGLVTYQNVSSAEMTEEYYVHPSTYIKVHRENKILIPSQSREYHPNPGRNEGYEYENDLLWEHEVYEVHYEDLLDDEEEEEAYYNKQHARLCRKYMCMPHAVWAFHLKEHIWRKLIVRDLEVVSANTFELDELRLESYNDSVPFSELLMVKMRAQWYPCQQEAPSRLILNFCGTDREPAALSVSRVTRRPLYRIQLLHGTTAPDLDILLQQARAFHSDSGCIILVDDVGERLQEHKHKPQLLGPLLRFMDCYYGVFILLTSASVGAQLKNHFYIYRAFDRNSISATPRRKLWMDLVRIHDESCDDYIDTARTQKNLSELESILLTFDEMLRIVQTGVLRKSETGQPDWELMKNMAKCTWQGFSA